ncbi:MAG TPA: hypothetical protein VLA66_01305 [Thermoanaerobaculia bacterium]|nr:hypothetical protein [Thermoanaerobaculia bacterium]
MTRSENEPLLTTSAIVYAAGALPLLFAPAEILVALGGERSALAETLLQLVAGLLFGFAMLNWMSRNGRVGGIYNRPLVVANFAQAAIVTATLARVLPGSGAPWIAWAALAIWLPVGLGFLAKLFRGPHFQEGA